MVNKKKIGITLRVVSAPNYKEKRDALSQEWTLFLDQINAIPVFIPNNLSDVKSFLEEMKLDGIILSGGDNIGDTPERDITESEIINFAIDSKIPLFGVCRGMQVFNKFFGGSIETNGLFNHVRNPHDVKISNTEITKILEKSSITVNSFHNNIILKNNLGKNLIPFAICEKDDSVEGFVHQSLPLMGVMWHPERDSNEDNRLILEQFFELKFLPK